MSIDYLYALGDLNGWVGDRVRVVITGALELQEKIIMEELWLISEVKRGCVGNTYFKPKSLCK